MSMTKPDFVGLFLPLWATSIQICWHADLRLSEDTAVLVRISQGIINAI